MHNFYDLFGIKQKLGKGYKKMVLQKIYRDENN